MDSFERSIIAAIPKLTRAALRFCNNNHANAADVVQDSLMRAMRTRANFTPGTDIDLWLRCIVRSEASHARRKGQRLVYSGEDYTEDLLCTTDVLASVQARQGLRAVAALEPKVSAALCGAPLRGNASNRHTRAKVAKAIETMQGRYI